MDSESLGSHVLFDRETFLALPDAEIATLVHDQKLPILGVYVPDGSRRLVLAYSDAVPNTEHFNRLCATLPAQYLLNSLKVFFSHGLSTLMVPILSRSVLNRGKDYRRDTALVGLQLLFHDETWQAFYEEQDIRVRVYGEPEQLIGTDCEPALEWIHDVCQRTSGHCSHSLNFAIGESAWLGDDIAKAGIAFFQTHGRVPTREEQIQAYYGENLPQADFFIMTSKMSGMGALPRFLVNGDTRIYFLPAAGALGLNEHTFRTILFDLLYGRGTLLGGYIEGDWSSSDRKALQDFYRRSAQTIIGIGEQVDNIWVPKW
jgi:hypothetical protein